ncbi:hypothetical protein [Kineosporia succinea]|uniref:Uncharacterized protein n=1 Tax=Kineosporia succinea TaxID=84632 RepID=A0ABT9PBV6_9ACTN|nr:hypothetical protein [Kineosporia succinea]MDP9830163.1 hypothetical protein [Kineosporia succinea]
MRRPWLYTRWFALVVGLAAGALLGLVVYAGSQLSGAALFVLCGTVAGGVAAFVYYTYTLTFRLTELRVSIPQFSDLTFAVTPSNEGVAWKVFVQAATRVSVQPLDPEAGRVREALNSLYTLFQEVRGILLEARPSPHTNCTQTVEHLAIAMLNKQLRPFMAKWHPRLLEWEQAHPGEPETAWPDNERCRDELLQMQAGLLEYVRGLGQLAGVRDVDVLLGT